MEGQLNELIEVIQRYLEKSRYATRRSLKRRKDHEIRVLILFGKNVNIELSFL